MTPTRAAAFAAIIASVSFTAMTPAFADNNMQGGRHGDMRQHRMMDMRGDMGRGGNMMLADFRCGPNAADRLDNRFDHMAEHLDLTAEQKALFDTFTASALTAQTGYADTCATLRPAATATDVKPDMVERIESRIKLDEARLAALNTVLPDFKAYYASLTDEQKADMGPRGDRRGNRQHDNMHHGKMRPGMTHDAKPDAEGSNG